MLTTNSGNHCRFAILLWLGLCCLGNADTVAQDKQVPNEYHQYAENIPSSSTQAEAIERAKSAAMAHADDSIGIDAINYIAEQMLFTGNDAAWLWDFAMQYPDTAAAARAAAIALDRLPMEEGRSRAEKAYEVHQGKPLALVAGSFLLRCSVDHQEPRLSRKIICELFNGYGLEQFRVNERFAIARALDLLGESWLAADIETGLKQATVRQLQSYVCVDDAETNEEHIGFSAVRMSIRNMFKADFANDEQAFNKHYTALLATLDTFSSDLTRTHVVKDEEWPILTAMMVQGILRQSANTYSRFNAAHGKHQNRILALVSPLFEMLKQTTRPSETVIANMLDWGEQLEKLGVPLCSVLCYTYAMDNTAHEAIRTDAVMKLADLYLMHWRAPESAASVLEQAGEGSVAARVQAKLAMIRFHQGRNQDALDAITRYLQHNLSITQRQKAQFLMGVILYSDNNKADAIEIWETLYEQTEDPTLIHALEVSLGRQPKKKG